jgi:uncharacterized membrane protein (TIGR01666 family)
MEKSYGQIHITCHHRLTVSKNSGRKDGIFIKELLIILPGMDYIKQYKSFITSQYLSDGVRITAGVALPAIILGYFGLLPVGISFSLGAMCVSGTDLPGPVHHRSNGMLICSLLIFVVSILTALAAPHPVLLGITITVFCFLFSMIGVYGSRSIAIGVGALLVMILNIDNYISNWQILYNALYILAGGLWYTALSLLLYGFRPFKLTQQALGDCITTTAAYLRARAAFYDRRANVDDVYKQLWEQQVALEQKQQLVRDLLFKSRAVVKESTNTGRTLVMIFTETVDLFEKIMTAYQDYKTLHRYFDGTDILGRFQQVIIELADELETIGIAVQSGRPSVEPETLAGHVQDLKAYYNGFRDKTRTPDNIEAFISLRHILQSIEDLAATLHVLHLYTTYDRKHSLSFSGKLEYDKFITHQDIDIKVLKDNLSMQSNTFRHSLRVSIATLAGFLISKMLHIGHSYWILLTIVVILKPTYSFTKKRNYERLLGTVTGALLGLLILYFIKDRNLLFGLMIVLMIGTYSFLRWKYLLAVILMTSYILLLFHLLYASNFRLIFFDRLIDTAAGSAIAIAANFFLVPAWEKEKIKIYMAEAINNNIAYFSTIASTFAGKPFTTLQYKLSRKNAFVALANLSDAFTRMLSEPKGKQPHIQQIHQFVVFNHMLTSHIATLSYYAGTHSNRYASSDFDIAGRQIIRELNEAKTLLDAPGESAADTPATEHGLQAQVNELLRKRRQELETGSADTATRKALSELKPVVDQYNFISSIAAELKKICAVVRTVG